MKQTTDRPRLMILGDARQVHLVRWATYFVGYGYDVLTISLEPSDRFPGRFQQIHVPRGLPDAVRYPAAAHAVRRAMKRFSPHVINAHFIPNYGLIATMLDFDPWVLSTWGSDVMTDPQKSAFHGWRTRRVLERARWVTSDAPLMTDRLRMLGVENDRILTFPLGVEMAHFFPRTDPLPEGPRIISNRKLEAVYSVDTVIDAFPAVHETFPGATLTVAGDGSFRGELLERAERSIASGATVFVGAVDHERVPTLLRESHIYVSMSLSDTTSVSLLEAMACGLFPIVSDIPANREWIEDGKNGVLVPVERPMLLATAIAQAWRDDDLRRRAREANLALITERARWEDNMIAVRDLFDRLCGRTRP